MAQVSAFLTSKPGVQPGEAVLCGEQEPRHEATGV